MKPHRKTWGLAAAVALLSAANGSAMAQLLPWNAYADDLSDSVCDVVNTANAELVVLSDTGEVAVITGGHPVLVEWILVVDSFVFFEGFAAGEIVFADDGDGYRTLWWVGPFGEVAELNDFTLEPYESGLFPEDFVDVPWDACALWDDPSDCGDIIVTVEVDGDFDGVEDTFDYCLFTPLGVYVEFDGCACFEVDGDDDGVDDCEDLCPDTFPGVLVDFDGCTCFDFDGDGDGVDDCDDLCPNTMPGIFVDIDGCEEPPVVVTCGGFGMLTFAMTLCGLVSLSRCRRAAGVPE